VREEKVLRIPGPVAGLALGAVLGASLFAISNYLQMGSRNRGSAAVPAIATTDPRGGVTVLVGSPADGVEVALLPLREDAADDAAEVALLARDLFPGEPPPRFRRLLVTHRGEGTPWSLALGDGSVVLEGADAEFSSRGLSEPYRRNHDSLSQSRQLALRVAGVDRDSLVIPPGGAARVLVAFPAETAASRPSDVARLADGARMWAMEVTTESLRSALAGEDLGRLEPTTRSQASGRRPDVSGE
jgi:hypothetical protein